MTNPKNLMAELYFNDEQEDMIDDKKTKITVQLDSSSAAMFTCIANRFGISRFALIEPLLKSAASDLFVELSPIDRGVIAKLADEEAVKIMKKSGATGYDWDNGEHVDITSNSWTKAAEYLAKDSK